MNPTIATSTPLRDTSDVSPVFAHAVEGATQTPDPALSEAAVAARRLRHLSQIGLALSAERDIRRLLAMILTASRELTGADGGTLYIVEQDAASGDKKLFFRASQNDSIVVDQSMTFAVGASSLAGYAALSGEVLRYDDVYHLPENAPFQFNPRFDHEHGYRSKSVLVVPLRDHNGDTIGVLQLINRKKNKETILSDDATVEREVVGFDSEGAELAMTLASQAAVALNNNLLLREIEELFESFVVASSSAIEDRDPSTSGHSQRVTQLTLGLARAVNVTSGGAYARVHFSPAQLRELRYAALLHDFGKIGVREAILTKDLKIEAHRFETIRSRVAILRAQREARQAKAKLAIYTDQTIDENEECVQLEALEQNCQAEREALERDARWLQILNEPPAIPLSPDDWREGLAALDRLRLLEFCDSEGKTCPLLSDEDVAALSVRRGTLTPAEFCQIQQHAQMSWEFLRQIPWTRGLEDVPSIAQSHHERLDGSGYPQGLNAQNIPLGAKMMAIADVFDALTANDRPYRRALMPEDAIKILLDEAERGKLDADLLDIFISRRVWEE